ncbi:hypothetical protein CN198_19040 [Sinorhizobium meliloti]|uniref:hypothetical protein n=1 Tax=Rhizobium meliloti TaxID=382 RepID=UPI000FD8B3AE|nr:hypothetical protein [Sinorhizobium meliloti]MDW9500275.1 hypothetical protein [Sinorhizobium meliloti]MDX0026908.1 hypothetical protein [Sinorhizobium meliloti]MDX0070398.1 hypothetical protein [Sinorhizobium meliloti]RVH66499.1 hypothetical protein CN198_19040 [Sinorhizobium meliloti]RVK64540.1 hypothetical protein CN159_23920 [Sinorhizobium meliloti]
MNRDRYTELAPWIAILVLFSITVPVMWTSALHTAIRDHLSYAARMLPFEGDPAPTETSSADPYRERELMAQITAANAAYGSMVISKWALVASVIGGLVAVAGAYYIKRTFDQTNSALLHAENSAIAAWEAVAETKKANQIAERAIVLEQRPWIMIGLKSIRIRTGPRTTMLDIETTLENIGRSPALMWQTNSLAARLPLFPPKREDFWRERFPEYQTIIPHGEAGALTYTSSFTVIEPSGDIDPDPSRFVLLRIGAQYSMNGTDEVFETVIAFDVILTDDRLARGVAGEYTEGFKIKSKPSQGWMT